MKTSKSVAMQWTRRQMMQASLRMSSLAAGAVLLPAWRKGEQTTFTPRQGDGPFYPQTLPTDHDHDLVQVTGQDAEALGTVLHLRGRVLDRYGAPLKGARVEIWQVDKNGIYHHPNDRKTGRDPGFQGFGLVDVDAHGAYAFRTIKPTAYSGRTPHIHVKVRVDGKAKISTQMYAAENQAQNARDFLYNDMSAAQQELVTVAFQPADSIEAGAVVGEFNIILNV